MNCALARPGVLRPALAPVLLLAVLLQLFGAARALAHEVSAWGPTAGGILCSTQTRTSPNEPGPPDTRHFACCILGCHAAAASLTPPRPPSLPLPAGVDADADTAVRPDGVLQSHERQPVQARAPPQLLGLIVTR